MKPTVENNNRQAGASPPMRSHFTIMVCPFQHGFDPKRAGRNRFLSGAWEKGWRPWIMRLEAAARSPDHKKRLKNLAEGQGISHPGAALLASYARNLKTMFHPPVLEAVYPDIFRLVHCRDHYRRRFCRQCSGDDCQRGRDGEDGIALLAERLSRAAAESPTARACYKNYWLSLRPEDTLRLTLPVQEGVCSRLEFVPWNGSPPTAFELQWADAYLFPFRVGFLCLKIRLLSASPQDGTVPGLENLMIFHNRFRDIGPHGWINEYDPAGKVFRHTRQAFLDRFLGPLRSDRPPTNPAAAAEFWINDYVFRYKFFSFVSLAGENWLDSFERSDGYYNGRDCLDALLYEMATTSALGTLRHETPGDQLWQPSQHYLADRLCAENRIDIWRYWRGMAIKDSAVFVGLADYKQPSASNFEDYFFPLYVYALNLKYQLFQFSNRLNLRYLQGRDRRIEKVLNDFLMFRNEFWFRGPPPIFRWKSCWPNTKKDWRWKPTTRGSMPRSATCSSTRKTGSTAS